MSTPATDNPANEETPLVSVITAFFNVELFLAEAIESVLSQDYHNYEMFLIDDGSTDGSTAIAKQYANKFPDRIFYLEHPGHVNKGVTTSRNLGISQSRGNLLALLDSDDVWLPAKLGIQVMLMQEQPGAEMICEASEYWYDEKTDGSMNHILQVGPAQDRLFLPPQLARSIYPLGKGHAPCPTGIMVRKPAVLRHGGFEEHFYGMYQMYEDQAFLIRLYLNEPVYISSLCNNRYRQRVGSLVQNVQFNKKYRIVRKYFLEWLEKYLRDSKLNDQELDKLVKKALMPYRQPLKYSVMHFVTRIGNAVRKRLPRR